MNKEQKQGQVQLKLLTKMQLEHLGGIQLEAISLIGAKYAQGAIEHGGCLSDMPTMKILDNAIDEAIDQVVYLLTLRRKVSRNEEK